MNPLPPPYPPAPLSSEEILRRKVQEYQGRIQRAIFGITEKCRREDRHRLDSYIRHANPSLKNNRDTQLPASLRRAARDPDRHQAAIYPGILHFHAGNAIVTFYEWLNGEPEGENLEGRIKKIEALAKHGPLKHVVIGNDHDGYEMILASERPLKFSDKLIDGNNSRGEIG